MRGRRSVVAEQGTPSRALGGEPMRSVVQERWGREPEDVLAVAEVGRPAIGDGEVLVRVRAASVDRGTWHAMAGEPYAIRLAGFGVRRPRAANPGRSLAGTVVAVGPGVTGLGPGDEVYGVGEAALAEYARARPAKLTAAPAGLTAVQAAAVPVSGLTALQAVRDRARVQPGESVLVIGASGGVGSFAVQLAKAAGARVTGVAGPAKLDLVRSLGADAVVDHSREEFLDGRRRYDVVLDTGGNRRLTDLRRALTARGRLVIVGGEDAGRWLGIRRQLRAQLLSPFTRQRLGTFIASEDAADLAVLRGHLEAGRVTPAVDRVFPLEQTAAALRHLLDGAARGKVVVAVAPGGDDGPGGEI
ncbi:MULTISPECIES: NAD(P)-dependent alcohol dehydrogenase [unclassified Blastococcus]